jgi:threonine/homoserine/homoserine lactone efflux protein
MIDVATFPLFLAAALVIAVTPGPGILYVASRTLAGGRAEGLASSFGTGLGGLVHVIASALGVSAVIMASAEAFTLMKLAGAAYLIWLGVKGFRDANLELPADVSALGASQAFRDGVIVEMFNPKTAAFFLAFIPQFIDPAQPVAPQAILLGVTSVALNTGVDVIVTFIAARARAGMVRRPSLMRRIRQGSAAIMCALGGALLLARR